VVGAALEQGHDVAAQAGLLLRLVLDGRQDCPACRGGLGRLQAGLDGRLHPGGHILDRLKHVQFQVGAPGLLRPRPGVKAVPNVVLARGAEFLQAVGADVVVGHDQAVGRDEAAGAAVVEAHRRLLDTFAPGVGEVEMVLLAEQLARRPVRQPHALVGPGVRTGGRETRKDQEQGGGEKVGF
jgi:hypothetical protein